MLMAVSLKVGIVQKLTQLQLDPFRDFLRRQFAQRPNFRRSGNNSSNAVIQLHPLVSPELPRSIHPSLSSIHAEARRDRVPEVKSLRPVERLPGPGSAQPAQTISWPDRLSARVPFHRG